MTVLQTRDLHLSFGTRVLFADVTFSVAAGERIAVVGRNGAGKSTLMKALAGQVPLDGGTVTLGRGATLGYLAQDLVTQPVGTLMQSVLSAVQARESLLSRYNETETSLARATDEADVLELSERLAQLGESLAEFEQRFGEHRAARLLTGLGFKQSDFVRPLHEFSGGWRMRAVLAGLLLSDPDVLLLDEPTNHLDVPTLAWFDQLIRRSRRAILLISHDRKFLNQHAQRVLHVTRGSVDLYTGNLDRFEVQKQQRKEQLQAQATAIELKREQLQTFVDRFGAKASKASQAQSKQKQLDKLESIDIEGEERTLGFTFPEVKAPGREVIRINGLKKAFAQPLFDEVTQVVQRGERIGIVGPNGAGKTTLLRLIAGELPLDAGTVELGHNVVMSYFAQHHADKLALDRTIYQELDALVPDASPAKLRQVAGAFLFSGDDVDKRISVLSGGERARVALAKLLLVPSNLLLLDEPTNHLDLDSSEALIQALKRYPGTVLFVSHNESFVSQLSTKLWEVGDGHAHSFPGSFDDYVAKLVEQMEPEAKTNGTAVADAAAGDKESAKERRQREAREREARRVTVGPLEKEVKRCESLIAALETEQAALEVRMADVTLYDNPDEARRVTQRFDACKRELEAALDQWSSAQQQLDLATSQVG